MEHGPCARADPPAGGERRPRPRRQARGGAPRRDRAGRARPPPDRGRAGRRQDHARRGAGALHRRGLPAHPVHLRHAAVRYPRRFGLAARAQRVRLQAGAPLHQHRAGRRDQSYDAEDAIEPSGGDERNAGVARPLDLSAAAALHGPRHAEPAGVRGDAPVARIPARPVSRADPDRVSSARRREDDPARRRRAVGGRALPGARRRGGAPPPGGGRARARRGADPRLRDGARGGHALVPAPAAGCEPARRPCAAPRRARLGARRRP